MMKSLLVVASLVLSLNAFSEEHAPVAPVPSHVKGVIAALDAIGNPPWSQIEDGYHYLKSAVFYDEKEFQAVAKQTINGKVSQKQQFFIAALEKDGVREALKNGGHVLVVTYALRPDNLGGSLLYFCNPTTGAVLFFRGGK